MKNNNVSSITIFPSFVESIDNAVNDDAEKGKLYSAIMHYALYGEEPELSGIVYSLFLLMRPVIDKSIVRKNCGKMGGTAKAENAKNNKQNASEDVANGYQNATKTLANGVANEKQTFSDKDKGIGLGIGEGNKERENREKKIFSPSPSQKYPETAKDVVKIANNACIKITEEQAQFYLDYRISREWIPNGATKPVKVSAIPSDLKVWLAREKQKENNNDDKGFGGLIGGKYIPKN